MPCNFKIILLIYSQLFLNKAIKFSTYIKYLYFYYGNITYYFMIYYINDGTNRIT